MIIIVKKIDDCPVEGITLYLGHIDIFHTSQGCNSHMYDTLHCLELMGINNYTKIV